MPRVAKNPRLPRPQVSAATSLPAAPKVVRIGRPANDNLPPWTRPAGRAIVIGGIVLVGVLIAALLYT